MTHPHLNAAHRLAVIHKLESIAPPGPTNAAPRFQPPQGPPPSANVRSIAELAASISSRVDQLRGVLDEARSSAAPPAAVARKIESAARRTASELSAARRAATVTAASYTAENGPPVMSRAEFQELSPALKSKFSKDGGKLI